MNLEKIQDTYKTVSYHKKPDNLTLEEWQIALRRQWADNHAFVIENIGAHPVFSDFLVRSQQSSNTYKVAIRDTVYEHNFCSCPDFRTNALGTCKHIESVLLHINKTPQLVKFLQKEHKQSYTSVYIKYGTEREVKIRIGTEETDEFIDLATDWFDEEGVLLPSSYYQFENFIKIASSISDSFRCYPDAMDFILEMRERRKRQLLIDSKYRRGDGFDNLLQLPMFPFQREGACFAAEAGRCLIADDMGLGKTLQAIAAAELLRAEGRIEKIYVVCPTSLKYQWQSEIARFTKKESLVIEGNPVKRSAQYLADGWAYKIVSYNTVSNDWREIQASEPDLIILDEAQRIKNYKSKVSKNVKQLQSAFAIVLSGTPLENKLEDLYSIMQFVNPYLLGPFYRYLHEHQVKNEVGKVTGYRNLHEITHLLSQCMVRRRRAEVLTQLPMRTDKTLIIPITAQQSQIHEEYKNSVARMVHKWKSVGFLNEKERQRLMISLNYMRMVCDSTYIIDQTTRYDTKIAELMNILDEFFVQGNEKVVVFSQWERMTRLVAEELKARNIGFSYLHGGVPTADRGNLFSNFNNNTDCRVFLSTDAGSTGLNLQLASLLINLDIPWNPAVLEQRIGRIHRMGQQHPVSIINLVASGTIEHRMLAVLQFKSNLLQGVLDNGEDAIFMGETSFNTLMSTISTMVEPIIGEQTYENSTEEDFTENNLPPTPQSSDEIVSQELAIAEEHIDEIKNSSATKTQDVIAQGLSFFGALNETLKNKEATQQFLKQLVHTDEKSGEKFLKIPIENQETIVNALSALGSLFAAINKTENK